jgi:non-specific protein-tyrosine kinase
MGRKVILVDADLRVPTIHTYFRQRNEGGLTAALARPEGKPISDYLVPTEIENLRLLTSGKPSSQPVQLLGSPQMAILAEELKAEADLVIFDSPAMLPIVDAMLLTRLADAAILVVRANETRAEALSRASDLLNQSGVRILGAVLTGVHTPHGSYTTYFSTTGWRRKRYAGWKNSLFALRRNDRSAVQAITRSGAGETPDQPEPKRKRS